MATTGSDENHSDHTTLRECISPQPRSSTPASATLPPPKELFWLKKTWLDLKVSPRQSKNIFKQSLPAIICLAMFQADWFANYFSTNGYIFAMVALVILPTQPRARYLQVLVQCIISTCLAAATILLALWCGTQARLHTTNPSAPAESYNSSQAAILGIWLLFSIWTASTVKSAYPTLMMPVLLAEIYLIVGCTSTVKLQTMDAALEFSDKLIVNFLLGLAVSTGFSIFIFPLSCRTIFFMSVTAYFNSMRKVIKTQQAFFSAMREHDPWSDHTDFNKSAEFAAHKKTLEGLYAAAANMRGELGFAGKEVALGNLTDSQMRRLSDDALRVMPAFSGLGFVYDVLSQSRYEEQEISLALTEEQKVASQWETLMGAMHQPFLDLSNAMDLAMEHLLLTLKLKKSPNDVDQGPGPGSADFIGWYDKQTQSFSKAREVIARLWFEREGIHLPDDFLENGHKLDEKVQVEDHLTAAHKKPFTLIYIHYLLYAASREILELVTFVDSMNADGTLSKRRLIVPAFKHMQQWTTYTFKADNHSESKLSPQTQITTLNASAPMSTPQTKVKKDPEHLPPTGWWQVTGNYIRLFPKLMRSTHASHGLRVACGVMSVAVGFYIKTSWNWFSENRWLWAMFSVVLTMNRTAGFSTFMFVVRICGTIVAMAASFAIYYMVVGHTVGVLILLWIWFLIVAYISIRYPFYLPACMVATMANVVMVGNELQDKKLGYARVSAAGQAAHQEYLMAPERLAIVAAGIGIGFFWTVFPYPLSEHAELRQDLASTFYYLASHHSMIAKTVISRAEGLYPNMATRNQNNLARARIRAFTKLQFLFSRLKQHLKFMKFQLILGGKFPTAQYAELVSLCEKICTASNVIGYASNSFVRAWDGANNATSSNDLSHPDLQWLTSFRNLLGNVDTISDEVTSTLVMLSNHMAAATPFPLCFKTPEEGKLAKTTREIGGNLLTVSHITEPGYAAFVTMTVARRGINVALLRQIEICKELVGVLDFQSYVDMDTEKGRDRLEDEEEAERLGPSGLWKTTTGDSYGT